VPGLRRIARFVSEQGAVPGIQLAHAGRKAAVTVPWDGDRPLSEAEGAWQIVGPSPTQFSSAYTIPTELTVQGIAKGDWFLRRFSPSGAGSWIYSGRAPFRARLSRARVSFAAIQQSR
jgi:hypothetical protein